jgi:hypothetical protein
LLIFIIDIMSHYSICDDCDNVKYCLCFQITIKKGEGSCHIPFKQYEKMYINTKKNKSKTSIIIFKNVDNTGNNRKRTVYRDKQINALYFKNFEDGKRVYLIPEEIKQQEEQDEEKASMADKQNEMFEKQIEDFEKSISDLKI